MEFTHKVEEALKVLRSEGVEIGPIKVQLAHLKMGDHYKRPTFASYLRSQSLESTDLYFKSFEAHDQPPVWTPELIDEGRCFRLTKSQSQVLRGMVHTTVAPQVVVTNIGTRDGCITSLSLKFPSISKVAQINLDEEDFYKFVRDSRQLEKLDQSLTEPVEPTGDGKTKKARKPRKSREDKAREELARLGLL